MLIIIFFAETLIGVLLMGLMCASGQTHRCEECRNEPKQGEWKIIGYDPLDMKFKCNTCGLKCNLATPYCPECGTKMKGADNV